MTPVESRLTQVSRAVATALCVVGFAQSTLQAPFSSLEVASWSLAAVAVSALVGSHRSQLRVTMLLAVFVALIALSLLWSDNALDAARGIAIAFCAIASAIIAASTFSWASIRWGLLAGFGIIMVSTVALVVVDPLQGLAQSAEHFGALRGPFSHRNILAYTACVALAAVAGFSPSTVIGRVTLVVAVAGLITVVHLTRSSTGTVALLAMGTVIALVSLIPLYRRSAASARRRIQLVIGLVLACLVVAISVSFDVIVGALGRDTTLTGRTTIWEQSLLVAFERPLLGFGWSSVWGPIDDSGFRIRSAIGFFVDHPHNAYIDAFLLLGAVGLLVFVAILVSTMITTAWATVRDPGGHSRWALLTMTVVLVYTLTESFALRALGLFVLTLVALSLSRAVRESSAPRGRLVTRLTTMVPGRRGE
jgi:O-antigen ligase